MTASVPTPWRIGRFLVLDTAEFDCPGRGGAAVLDPEEGLPMGAGLGVFGDRHRVDTGDGGVTVQEDGVGGPVSGLSLVKRGPADGGGIEISGLAGVAGR